MRLLAIESSCDETAAAIVEGSFDKPSVSLQSNVLASSLPLHAKTGGIIPEVAAREQLRYMLPVIAEALEKAHLSFNKINPPGIDGIAVTYGPGLIGSLLVGVETAKTLSYIWKKPLIPVNHLIGHIYANWVDSSSSLRAKRSNLDSKQEIATSSPEASPRNDIIKFPALGLIVSGGHTDLILINQHGNIKWIGGTRDDAAGEAFDKIGRLLGLPYPAGQEIEKRAKLGRSNIFSFPRPMKHTDDFDFSFSGLKTAVLGETNQIEKLDEQIINDICLETQNAIVDVLVTKTIKAAEKYAVKSILIGGGVASNKKLQEKLILDTKYHIPNTNIFVPPKILCTDNAAMIGAAAIYNPTEISWKDLAANPQLHFK